MNKGLVVPDPVEGGLVTCDVCQRVILVWHFQTVGRRGGTELDMCNVCRHHLAKVTKGHTLKGLREDGTKTCSVSFAASAGAGRCRICFVGRVRPPVLVDAAAKKTAIASQREEEHPEGVAAEARFDRAGCFALTTNYDSTDLHKSNPHRSTEQATTTMKKETVCSSSANAHAEETTSKKPPQPHQAGPAAVGSKRPRSSAAQLDERSEVASAESEEQDTEEVRVSIAGEAPCCSPPQPLASSTPQQQVSESNSFHRDLRQGEEQQHLEEDTPIIVRSPPKTRAEEETDDGGATAPTAPTMEVATLESNMDCTREILNDDCDGGDEETRLCEEVTHPPSTLSSPSDELLGFFRQFEVRAKAASHDVPPRCKAFLQYGGRAAERAKPLLTGACVDLPEVGCVAMRGRVVRCISVEIVPTHADDREVHIAVLGQCMRYQMDIWRCQLSDNDDGCSTIVGSPVLAHHVYVGAAEPLGASWVPLPLKSRTANTLGVCTLLRSRNLSTMTPPYTATEAGIVTPNLTGVDFLDKPATRVEWARGATTLENAFLLVAFVDGSLCSYLPSTDAKGLLRLTPHHTLSPLGNGDSPGDGGLLFSAAVYAAGGDNGGLLACCWGSGRYVRAVHGGASEAENTTPSPVQLSEDVTSVLCCRARGTLAGCASGAIFGNFTSRTNSASEPVPVAALPTAVLGLHELRGGKIAIVEARGQVSVLDWSGSACVPRVHFRVVTTTDHHNQSITSTVTVSSVGSSTAAATHGSEEMGAGGCRVSASPTQGVLVCVVGAGVVALMLDR